MSVEILITCDECGGVAEDDCDADSVRMLNTDLLQLPDGWTSTAWSDLCATCSGSAS